jgi:3-oxoacyl-[acyl-carrier protein] reductase
VNLGLAGRRALVLGSTSGLGRAVALRLSEEGARVAVHGRDRARARDVASGLPDAVVTTGDLMDPGVGEAVVRRAAEELGGLDVLVCNTGGGGAGGILDTAGDQDDLAYRSMLRPMLEAARAASPLLRRSDAGRMVVMTARSVVEASPELALSSVFRSGAAAAARSLALELANDGVLVNVVVTGQFDTPALDRFEAWIADREGADIREVRRRHVAAIPLGRLGRAEELADVATFLCSARASFVTGATVAVDGGATRGF